MNRFQQDEKGTLLCFGMHKGSYLDEVPADYLRWVLRDIPDLSEEERTTIIKELDERVHRGVGSFDFGD